MYFGAAKKKITPPLGTWMAGYGFRDRPCERISEDLYIRAQAEITDGARLVFIYADLERWDNGLVAAIREKLAEGKGLKENEILFMASHSHSGPVTGHDGLIVSDDRLSPEYDAFVIDTAVRTACEAMEHIEEVSITRYNGKCMQNVFRRVWEDGHTIMAPNYDVPVDRNLTVIVMRNAAGSVRGMQVHYPCHANLANGYDIHPDYPGIALRMLDEKYPGSIALFMQGCTGDIRPNSVCGDRFVPAQYDKVLAFAERFVGTVLQTMQGHAIAVGNHFRAGLERFSLPLEGVLSEEELQELSVTGTEFEKKWACAVLQRGNQPTETMELMTVKYSEGLKFFAINGEVVQEYAAFARTLDSDYVTIAYANGMIGYIPTAKEIVEGGYESIESPKWFALAGTFDMNIERIIKKKMTEKHLQFKNN